MRVAVALLCLIVIIVGTTADSTKDEKSGISRVMRGVRNGNSAKKKPQEKVGGKRTRKPRRKIKSKGRKVGSKRPGNRRGGKRGGKRSNKNPGRKAAAKKSTKKRGKVSKSKSVKKTNRGNQPRTSGTSRQALKGNDCDYIDLGAITTAGTGCATNGVKFVIKGNSGVRKQFLYVDGKVIIALTKLKFAECTAFTDITSQVNCKAVAGLDVVSLVGTNTPATPGATTSSSSSGSTTASSGSTTTSSGSTTTASGSTTTASGSTTTASGNTTSAASAVTTTASGCKCGIKGSGSKIVGGTETGVFEYPWFAAVSFSPTGAQSSYGCGATLISAQFAVCASHCFIDNLGNPSATASGISLVLGDHNVNSPTLSGKRKVFSVSQIITHPSYNPTVNNKNDIALLKLSTPADLNVYTPICLPASSQTYANKTAQVYGFGTTSSGGVTSPVLLKVDVPVVTTSVCQTAMGANTITSTGMVCAGGEAGKDSCQGDSGGPLSLAKSTDATKQELIGVVSFGNGCALADQYGVYADVSFYRDWVDTTIAANGGGTFCPA